MIAGDKIGMALLAAKLAKESLELLTMDDITICRLQFHQIVVDLRELEKHLDSIAAKQKVHKEVIPPPPGGRP